MTKYLTCAETAKIVRQALKESFPDVKFSVRSSTYAGGASMSVRWTDGPNTAQVSAVARKFESSYFDASIDYKGSIYHMMDGEMVSFGADSIHCTRDDSDAAVERAIARMMRKYEGNFKNHDGAAVTVEAYRRGEYWNKPIPGMEGGSHHFSIQGQINEILFKQSDRLKVAESKTAKRVFATHDDDYSRTNGAGFSVMPDGL